MPQAEIDYDAVLDQRLQNRATANTENPYLALLQGEEDRRRQQMLATTALAFDTPPDQYATQRRVAQYLGYPTAVVTATPEDSRREAQSKQLQTDVAAHPVLQRRYSDDDFARLAHDDSGALSKIGDALAATAKYTFGHPDSDRGLATDLLAGGVYDLNHGAAGMFRALLEAAAPVLDPVVGTVLPENPLRRAAAGFAALGAQAKATADALSPPTDSVILGGVSSGVRSAAANAVMLPFALQCGEAATLQLGAGDKNYKAAIRSNTGAQR